MCPVATTKVEITLFKCHECVFTLMSNTASSIFDCKTGQRPLTAHYANIKPREAKAGSVKLLVVRSNAKQRRPICYLINSCLPLITSLTPCKHPPHVFRTPFY